MMHGVFYLLQETASTNPGLWENLVRSNILNFLFAFIVLFWLFKKFNVIGVLDQRQAQVTDSLHAAEALRKQAMTELEQIEIKTAALKTEIDTLLSEAANAASSLAESVIQQAEVEADKIIENAQKRIALDQKNAARELEHRLMVEALHAAEEMLVNTLSKDDKIQSVSQFVDSLPTLAVKEGAL